MKLTAKEKARDLVWIKLEMVRDDSENETYEDVRSNEANTEMLRKEVALIVIDEILEAYNPLEYYPEDLRNYWEEVKKEVGLL
jgi:hypothetical protein